jgi:hypothetical protein
VHLQRAHVETSFPLLEYQGVCTAKSKQLTVAGRDLVGLLLPDISTLDSTQDGYSRFKHLSSQRKHYIYAAFVGPHNS